MASDLESKICPNCRRSIAVSNYVMHEAHCSRYITVCEKCDEPVPLSEIMEHTATMHGHVNCPQCQAQVEKEYLQLHLDEECDRRRVSCMFCNLLIELPELLTHESYCGSRTEQCTECSQFIMLKDWVRHMDTNCNYPQSKAALSSPQKTDQSTMENGMEPDFYHNHAGGDFFRSEMRRILECNWAIPQMSSAKMNHAFSYDTECLVPEQDGLSSSNSPIENSASKDLIPCEFCKIAFSPEMISDHQVICAACDTNHFEFPDQKFDQFDSVTYIRNNLSEPNSDKSLLSIKDIHLDDDSLNSDDMYIWESTTEDEDSLPCEFCGMLLSQNQLLHHQGMCESDSCITPRDMHDFERQSSISSNASDVPLLPNTNNTKKSPANVPKAGLNIPRSRNNKDKEKKIPSVKNTFPTNYSSNSSFKKSNDGVHRKIPNDVHSRDQFSIDQSKLRQKNSAENRKYINKAPTRSSFTGLSDNSARSSGTIHDSKKITWQKPQIPTRDHRVSAGTSNDAVHVSSNSRPAIHIDDFPRSVSIRTSGGTAKDSHSDKQNVKKLPKH